MAARLSQLNMKLVMCKLVVLIIAGVSCLSLTCTSVEAGSPPVLFFSDLTWGPKTGWEQSTTKGAAVTIWGKNFGTARGSNYVTVNGAQLTSDTSYAEWDAIGPARGLERITFWLNSTCADGAGYITVTVNGVTSNQLPFTVMNGTIYFISVTDGSNSYNGLYSTRSGHTGNDGPFKDLLTFNPAYNPSGDGQYIMYVRGGTYTTPDADSTMVALRGPYGGPTKQKALIGYPADTAAVTVDTSSLDRGIIWIAAYDPYGFVDYLTLGKIVGVNGGAPFTTFGSYTRVVGCTFHEYLADDETGIIQVTDSKHTSLYGNLTPAAVLIRHM